MTETTRVKQLEENDSTTNLERHELVIGFGGPGVDFDAVLQGDNQELNALIFDYFEVNAALQLSNVGPAIATIGLL